MARNTRNIKDINLIFFLTVMVNLFASLLPLSEWFTNYSARLLFSEFVLVAPSVFYMVVGRKNYAVAVRFRKIRISTVLWLFLFTICLEPVLTLINSISMLFVDNAVVNTMDQIVSNNSLLFSLLLIAALPAFLEESVYRGIFFNEYRKVSPWGGVVLSALLFGLMHGNINQFSYAFLMGMVFALIIEATDSILASMIMHFLLNGISTTLMFLTTKLPGWIESNYQEAVTTGNDAMVGVWEQYRELADTLKETSSTAVDRELLLTSIRTMIPTALVCGAVAVVIFWVIASNEGQKNHIRAMFGRKQSVQEREMAFDDNLNTADTIILPGEKRNSVKQLISIPLLCGIAILAFLMIAVEFM